MPDQTPTTNSNQVPEAGRDPSKREGSAQARRLFEKGVHLTAVTLVQRPAMDLYTAWREIEHLPRFIDDLVRVEQIDAKTSRWTAEAAFNGTTTLQWIAEVINDRPGEVLAWQTVAGSEVELAGSVRFRELPHKRGSEVRVTLEYVPPIGTIADAIAKVFTGDARSRVRGALHRFRQVMETGEIATAQGQPAGKSRWRTDRPGEGIRKTDADVRDIADATPGRFAEGSPPGGEPPILAPTAEGQVYS